MGIQHTQNYFQLVIVFINFSKIPFLTRIQGEYITTTTNYFISVHSFHILFESQREFW